MSMTKKDLIEKVSFISCISKKDVALMLDILQEVIMNSLSKGEIVSIHGFGKFIVYKRDARNGYSPANGKSIIIKERNAIRFKASSSLIERIK